MTRVLKVMAILVALSLVSAVSLQPATAYAGDVPAFQENSGSSDDDSGFTEWEVTGDPGESGEGDPDVAGDGFGARSDNSDFLGFLGDLLGAGPGQMTVEEFICYLMLQFMPTP